MTLDDLVAAARAWHDDDPDPETRAEVERLLEGDGVGPDLDGLRDRFGATLAFGTAGLRGEMGAGPNRMNRVTVMPRHGRAGPLPGGHRACRRAGGRGLRRPPRLGHVRADAAAVLAGARFPVHLADRHIPTPVLAFGVRHLGACAGVQITASHNPPRDNGYKVYLGDGAQIVPPADAEIAARIDAVGPLASVERAPADDPRVMRIGADLIDAYVAGAGDAVPRRSSPDGAARLGGRVHAIARCRAGRPAGRLRPGRVLEPGGRARTVRARSRLSHGGVPQPRGARCLGSRARLGDRQ